jgi:hypothetical protein
MILNVCFCYSARGYLNIDTDELDPKADLQDEIKKYLNSRISFESEYIDDVDLDGIEYVEVDDDDL